MPPPADLWQEVRERIREAVTEQAFATWFEPIKPVALTDSILTLEVPSQFYYEWIDTHYRSLILRELERVTQRELQLRYSIVVGDEQSTGEAGMPGGESQEGGFRVMTGEASSTSGIPLRVLWRVPTINWPKQRPCR